MRYREYWRVSLCAMVFAGFLASTAAFAQEARQLAKGQTLYLPIYSHMAYGNLGKSGKASQVLLSALVDTNGMLLGERVPTPTVIPPYGTLELFVELNDASGGSGANFIVKWDADQLVNPPLLESLHANMDGGKAVIFMTQSVPLTE